MSSNTNDDNDTTDLENRQTVTEHGDRGEQGLLRSKISDVQLPFILVFITSIILLIAVTSWEADMKSRGYAISVPALSMCLSLGGIHKNLFREDIYAAYGRFMAHVLFAWNFTGACFLTFSSPFTTTGNGYFAAWACVVTSAMAMGFTADALKDSVKDLGSLMGLCASSVVLIFALIQFVGSGAPDSIRGESIYAMSVACLTVVLVFGLMYFQKQPHGNSSDSEYRDHSKEGMVRFGFLSFFALLWLVLACLVTFSGPFVTTGNGYFASWGGAACACLAAFNSKKETGITMETVLQYLTPVDDTDTAGSTVLSPTIK